MKSKHGYSVIFDISYFLNVRMGTDCSRAVAELGSRSDDGVGTSHFVTGKYVIKF